MKVELARLTAARRMLVLAPLLALPVAGAGADELPLAAAITAVTLYPDRAEVTRIGEIELAPGSHRLLLTGLPSGLVPDSLRVGASGPAAAALLLGSVEARPLFQSEAASAPERALEARIQELEDRSRGLQDQSDAVRIELDMIRTIGQTLPERAGDEIRSGMPDPAQWQKSWSTLGSGAADALARIRTAGIEQRRIARELEPLRRELDELRTGARESITASIDLQASQAQRATVQLSYQVPGASWRPIYEARLDSAAGRLTLVQLAELRQSTGEGWDDVAITLSTARPGESASLPELEPWFVDIAEPPRPLAAAPAPAGAPTASFRRSKGAADEMQAEEAMPAQVMTAEIVTSPFTAEYRVPGTSSIAADNAPRTLTIASRELEASLGVRIVPRLAEQAFLSARLQFPGPDPLLDGTVALFRDGSFVGRTNLPPTRPGETIDLSFGQDDRVAVDYRLETGGRSSEGIFNKSRRIERRYRIAVTSHHDQPIEITVQDQIPVPQDERITVELLSDSTPPTAENPDGKRGLLEWRRTFAPGEQQVITFAYAVTLPEGLELSGF